MIDRIRHLLAWQQLSPTQFADFIGVGRPVISHILSERNKPSLDVVQRIIAAFPAVSLPWLLSGTGAMLVVAGQPDTPAPVSTIAPPVVPLAPVLTTAPPSAAQSTPANEVSAISLEAAAAMSASRRTPTLQAPPLARFVANKLLTVQPVEPMPLPAAPTPAEAAQAPRKAPTTATAVAVSAVSPIQEPIVALSPAIAELEVANLSTTSLIAPTTPSDAATMLPLLAESGKAIRRIVVFYRDGSFADYLPES